MERLYPTYQGGLDPLSIYDDLALPPAPDGRPFVGINMVASVDGKITVKGEHRKVKLGSRVDRALMERVRAHFDAVVRGARTVRANSYLPGAAGTGRAPVAVVVTGSLDLPFDSDFFSAQGVTRVIFTTEASDPAARERFKARADVIVCGERRVDLEEAFAILRKEYGIERLLVEGGASLNWGCVKAALVDTIFATLAPKLVGYEGDLTMIEGPDAFDPVPRLELASLYHHEGELFFRWTLT